MTYLNLGRFRYRQKIREGAQQLFDRFRSQPHFRDLEYEDDMLDQIKLLMALSNLSNNIPTDKKTSPTGKSKQVPIKSAGVWAIIYYYVFHWHVDRWAIISTVLVALPTLFFSTAFSLGLFGYSCAYHAPYSIILFLLIMLSIGMIIPILFIFLGNRIVTALRKKTTAAYRQLAWFIVKVVPELQLPPLPEHHADGETTPRQAPE